MDEEGTNVIEIFGKIIANVKPKCKNLDDMVYMEGKQPYRKTLFIGKYPCDKCGGFIDTTKGFYNCSKCKYDLCLECSGHNQSIKEQTEAKEKKEAEEKKQLLFGPNDDQENPEK